MSWESRFVSNSLLKPLCVLNHASKNFYLSSVSVSACVSKCFCSLDFPLEPIHFLELTFLSTHYIVTMRRTFYKVWSWVAFYTFHLEFSKNFCLLNTSNLCTLTKWIYSCLNANGTVSSSLSHRCYEIVLNLSFIISYLFRVPSFGVPVSRVPGPGTLTWCSLKHEGFQVPVITPCTSHTLHTTVPWVRESQKPYCVACLMKHHIMHITYTTTQYGIQVLLP